MTHKDNEYLFLVSNALYNFDNCGMMLRSSNENVHTISLLLNDNVYPPYISHKFMREEILQIRDYLNDYLERTNE